MPLIPKRAFSRVFIARKAKRHTPTARPLRAVIVCIDAATRSGFATYVCGKLHHYCEVDTGNPPERRRALRDAQTTALTRGLPLGGVIEVPFGGRLNAALALTAWVKLWRDSWLAYAPPAALIEHTAPEWRRPLFGHRPLTRDAARNLEAALAWQVAHRDLPRMRHHCIGPDASAAICIGQVAIRSAGLHAALGCDLIDHPHQKARST